MVATGLLNKLQGMVSSETGLDTTFLDKIDLRLQSFSYELQSDDVWIIGFCIQSVASTIKNECNIATIPKELEAMAVDMVCGEFLAEKKALGQLNEEQVEPIIKSISEGDTSYTYAEEESKDKLLSKVLDTMRKGNESELLKYRRIVW